MLSWYLDLWRQNRCNKLLQLIKPTFKFASLICRKFCCTCQSTMDHIFYPLNWIKLHIWIQRIVRIIGSYPSPYWRSRISSTSVRNSVFLRVGRNGTSGKTLNFSHEWKKSQIFNKDECKYLFLPFQLKNKACPFHSFIGMSMSCLLHKILQRHVQCSKYTLI